MTKEEYIKLIEEVDPILSEAVSEVFTGLVDRFEVEGTIDGNMTIAIFEAMQNSLANNLIRIIAGEAQAISASTGGASDRGREALRLLGLSVLQLSEGTKGFLDGTTRWPNLKTVNYN